MRVAPGIASRNPVVSAVETIVSRPAQGPAFPWRNLSPKFLRTASLLAASPLLAGWNGDSLTGKVMTSTALAMWGMSSLAACAHAFVTKKGFSSKVLWGITQALPFFGPLLYVMGGIHHVPLEHGRSFWQPRAATPAPSTLTKKNSIEPLVNGEQAYPEMLHAIEEAKEYIFISSYVFEGNQTGEAFVAALKRALGRGVDVRVIVDGLGKYLTLPTGHKILQRGNIPVAQFLLNIGLKYGVPLNYRMHERFLVSENVSFMGGINIGDTYLADNRNNPSRHKDLHFKITGNFGQQLTDYFVWEWEMLTGDIDIPPLHQGRSTGTTQLSLIRSAPDHDYENFKKRVIHALDRAQKNVRIMTAYFAPDQDVTDAFSRAVQRGVAVEIILSEDNFVPPVDWSARTYFPRLIKKGIRLYYQPAPFDHSKMIAVDDGHALVGGGNIDNRSFTLNFEANVEIGDQPLTAWLINHFESVKKESRAITTEDYEKLPVYMKVLARLSRLLAPLY